MFLRHCIETNSTTAQTSALVLFMRDKMIVEFSDTGALYVYNQNHDMVKLVTKGMRTMTSTNDLKIPSMQALIVISDWGTTYNYEEGRMTHQGYWQSRLTGWLSEKILSSNARSTVFHNSKDDKIFKAVPLPEEPNAASIQKSKVDLPKERKVSQQLDLRSNITDDIESSNKELKEVPKYTSSEYKSMDVNEVIYENNIKVSIYSKVIFDNIRVVANNTGFYVTNLMGTKYALLKEFDKETSAFGSSSIWIRNAKKNVWCEIVHFFLGQERSMGFLKKSDEFLYYKEKRNDKRQKQINL